MNACVLIPHSGARVKLQGLLKQRNTTRPFCKHGEALLRKLSTTTTCRSHYQHHILSFSRPVFTNIITPLSPCDGLQYTHCFVFVPLCSLTKWMKTGWHLVFSCVLSNVPVLPSWPATALQTHWLLWLTLSFVQCPSLRLLSLWPCTWTCVFLPPGEAGWCVWLFPHSGGPQEGSAAQKWPHCTRRLLTLWSVGLSDCGFVCLHIWILFVTVILFSSPDMLWKHVFMVTALTKWNLF